MRGRPLAWPVATLLVLLLLLAGCSTSPDPTVATRAAAPPELVETDFITPGVWDVRGDTDYMMVWAHNLGTQAIDAKWGLTGLGGTALPAGWNVTFDTAHAVLQPDGTKVKGPQSMTYPDWARAEMTLRIPATDPARNVTLELHAGPQVQNETVVVHAHRGPVAVFGSHVYVDTVGSFSDNGQVFWNSEPGHPFDTILGDRCQQCAVPGVGFGLIGVTAGETVELYIPPPFAYGYDNQVPQRQDEPDYTMFNGHTLVFRMTMTRFS